MALLRSFATFGGKRMDILGTSSVVVDVLVLVVNGVLVLTLTVAMGRMLLTRRRQYLLVALAVWAWSLRTWVGTAAKYDVIRASLGVPALLTLTAIAEIVFAVLTIQVLRYVWGRAVTSKPTPAQTPKQAPLRKRPPADVPDAWLV
jgi:hypothetical protein